MAHVPPWFARLMVMLAEAYPSMRLREGTFRAYYAALCDLPETSIEAACARAPREYPTYFPSAGELRMLVTGRPEDAGVLAWAGLQQAASAVGAYASLVCEDGAVAEAVQRVFGSWPSFCEQCVDGASAAWGVKRTEFLAAYREARRHHVPGHEARLAGTCEQQTPQLLVGSWLGTLDAGGAVHPQRVLPGAADVAQLPEATFEEEPK